MITTIAKRIQSRLSRQGVKVSLGEIRPIYKELVKDTNKPTDEEISAIVEHFTNNATKLSVISEELEIDTTATTEEEPEVIALIPQSEEPETVPTGEELATVDSNVNDVNQLQTTEYDTNTEESETSMCVSDENGNLDAPAQIQRETLTQFHTKGNEELEETAIALQEKSELVASTANDMGITLSIEEVTAIAENFDYASVNSDYEIAEIESAITAFVQHKAQATKQKITNMVQGVRETVTRLDNENSQLLNDGLREINNDIKRGSHKFKSQVTTALKAFALPPSKTG
ncbi:hypothetical protein [Nostoc sp. TCL26-01]|uniref:hypothetical protein n=1 Tax=Nostoc sp. TCL26-01 TaxID=2576904 RepID=UPI0015BDB39C|nr:hypothetical protein [Nostoc sp. TCL26-01]QLE59932.1 hypothetical protein FD725_31465 [Nostoc sp. TCL26-01]